MNNNKAIKTYDDLLQEEQRLTAHLATLKMTIKEDITDVKQGLKEKLVPVKKIKAKVSDLFTRGDQNGPVLNFALNFVLDYIIRLFIPKQTSVWTKTVIPFFTKNWVSHLITDEQRLAVHKFVNESLTKVDNMIRKSGQKKKETQHYRTPAAEAVFSKPEMAPPPPAGVNTNPMGL